MSESTVRPVLFFAFANDRDDRLRYLRNLPREASGIRDVLDRYGDAPLWEVVERRNATLGEILDVFQDARYRGRIVLFHFGGHAGSDELLLETSDGGGQGASASTFVTFLRQQQALRLVFLNGCSTQGQVRALLAAGVPSVIATSRAIDDLVATNFAVRFYQGLAGGAGLRVAFEESAASQQSVQTAQVHRKVVDDVEATDDRWPWELRAREGAEASLDWNLGDAAGEPLLGLPPLPAIDLPATPYRHLNWFVREHAALFFGRGREIRDLFERLTSEHTPPVTLLYGQSGVGKSSLLAAGLLPRLEGIRTTRYLRRDRDVALRTTLRRSLGGDERLPARRVEAIERSEGRPLIVLLDQLEEAFTRPNPDEPGELDEFLAELGDLFLDRARRPAGKILLGFRKEWLADIQARLERLTLPHSRIFLEHLDAGGIEDAIAGPTRTDALRRQYHLTVESGLPTRIAGDLLEDRGSPIAPALQLLLSKLWDRAVERAPNAPHFDNALYTELKREGVLLQDFLDQQLCALQDWNPELTRVGLVLDVLAQHTTSIGSSRPCSRESLESTYAHQHAVLQELIDHCRRLLLLVDAIDLEGAPGTDGTTRLIHDAVALLVRRRFEQSDLPGQRARRLLERHASAWENDGVGEPLGEADLTTAEAGANGMRGWTPAESRLVAASLDARVQRREQRQVATIVRALLTSQEAQDDPLVAALLLAELDGRPVPEEGIQQALRIVDRPIPAAVLEGHRLAVASLAFSPDGLLLATGSLDGTVRLSTLDATDDVRVLTDHTDAVTCVAFSPDGRSLATASLDGTALLHDVDQSRRVRPLFGHMGVVNGCQFSRDGRLIATWSTDGTVRIWHSEGDTEPRILGGHDGGVRAVEFSPRNDGLLTVDMSGSARIWHLDEGAAAITIASTQAVVTAVYRSDGEMLVTSTADGEVCLWPLAGPMVGEAHVVATADPSLVRAQARERPTTARRTSVGGFEIEEVPSAVVLCSARHVPSIAHSVSRDTLAIIQPGTADDPSQATEELALAPSMHESWRLKAAGVSIFAAVFAPEGTAVAACGGDGDARLWQLTGPAPDAEVLTHAGAAIVSLTFSPDGCKVATADAGGSVRIWHVGGTVPSRRIRLPDDLVTRLVRMNDGTIEVDVAPRTGGRTGEATERLRIDLTTDRAPQVVERFMRVSSLSPDRSRLLATMGRTVVVLGERDGSAACVVAADLTTVRQLTFSPDSSRLYVHERVGVLHSWTLATGAHEWRRRDIEETGLSADGRWVITRDRHNVVRALDSADGDVAWQHAEVADFSLHARLEGDPRPWVLLVLRDGTSVLRNIEAGPVLRFPEVVRPFAIDVTHGIVLASAERAEDWRDVWRVGDAGLAFAVDEAHWAKRFGERGWVASKPATSGSVVVWPTAQPDQRSSLSDDVVWCRHDAATGVLFLLSAGGDLRAWNTADWGSERPDEGRLVDRDVDRVDVAPTGEHAAIRSRDGTLKLLDPGLTTVSRTLAGVTHWSWSPGASRLAFATPIPAQATSTLGAAYGDAGPNDAPLLDAASLRVLMLASSHNAAAGSRDEVELDLGLVANGGRHSWLSDACLSAAVKPRHHSGTPPALWHFPGVSRAPLGPAMGPTHILIDDRDWSDDGPQAVIAMQNDYWCYVSPMDPRWRVERLYRSDTDTWTARRELDLTSLNAPLGASAVFAFSEDKRLAIAQSLDGTYWVSIVSLTEPVRESLVTSGMGSVQQVAFAAQRGTLEVRLVDGKVKQLSTDDWSMLWPDDTTRIVSVTTSKDARCVVALLSDGTARLWHGSTGGRAIRLAAPGRRIRLRAAEGDAYPAPDIVLGTSTTPWIVAHTRRWNCPSVALE
ncbi:MAG: CHAT domain-containing protein [Gemmatimonadetes bacterium]|nr:CHAT domain-containing protein [Gemmatimonadota bacterium]